MNDNLKLNSGDKVESLFGCINELPSLSPIILKIENVMNNQYVSVEDISNLISTDQALVAKILRVVNSGFYGFKHKISTVTHAITIMGLNAIKNIVLASEVFDAFPIKNSVVFDRYLFWEHCLSSACAARAVAKMLKMNNAEVVFIAGILHDIGKLLIAKYLPNQLNEISFLVIAKGMDIIDAELEVCGVDHSKIGEKMARKWFFPPVLSDIIALHHESIENFRFKKELACVKLGDFFSKLFCFGHREEDKIRFMEPEVWGILDTIPDTRNNIYRKIFTEMLNSSEFLNSLIY